MININKTDLPIIYPTVEAGNKFECLEDVKFTDGVVKSLLFMWFIMGVIIGFSINLFWPHKKIPNEFALPSFNQEFEPLRCGVCNLPLNCNGCGYKLAAK